MEHVIDAKNKRLGRLATEIATILQGKHKPGYNPRLEGDDTVRIKNISKLTLSGNKAKTKIYYRHTGPLGHLKEDKFAYVFEKKPEWVLRHAVRLMLPKNKLAAKRLKKLIIEK
ncbi:50S ribosomal protein L13 [Patescibacteria group bacterium]|nr:50S ribosomal protein L13 [Patescibacteria group bacterium]